jgi:hypothetical protein
MFCSALLIQNVKNRYYPTLLKIPIASREGKVDVLPPLLKSEQSVYAARTPVMERVERKLRCN